MNANKTLAIVVKDYTDTPVLGEGTGVASGDAFFTEKLKPAILSLGNAHDHILIDLDGTKGFSTSFLLAAFGKLNQMLKPEELKQQIEIKSEEDPFYKEQVEKILTGSTFFHIA